MIKKIFFAVLLSLMTAGSFAQQLSLKDSLTSYFDLIKTLGAKNTALWNYDLYAPMLLVNRETRELYANYADNKNVLKKDGAIYTGKLPDTINISNTALDWDGRRWSMIWLPLPPDPNDLRNVSFHELFHNAQPALGFKLNDPSNDHLDKLDGRIFMRLELEALKKALLANTPDSIKMHLTNAFLFRKYRQSLYPGSEMTENSLELNEGIAEYTGIMLSGRDKTQMQQHFITYINTFFGYPSFVRSFCYQTIPVYGYLLQRTVPYWNQKVHSDTELTNLLIKDFGITLPATIPQPPTALTNEYNGVTILKEETERDRLLKIKLAENKQKFITGPHLDIKFEKMNISFNPTNIFPLEQYGTVYPTMRVTDKWGILEVSNGALLDGNWSKVTLTQPTTIGAAEVKGDGWTLTLNKGYIIKKDGANYTLQKQ